MERQLYFGLLAKVFLLASLLLVHTGWTQSMLIRYLHQGSDDAGWEAGGCGYSTGFNEIYFGQCQNGNDMVGGFRFQNIPYSSPDEIVNAYLEFTVDGTYQNHITVRIYGEASDDAQTFSQSSKPSDRPLTTNYVEWDLTSSDVWTWNTTKRTPDIAPVIKEIIGRAGWSAGNSLAILITNAGNYGEHRRVYAYEREGQAKGARLVINDLPPNSDLYDIYQRIELINFDPQIPSEGNQRIHEIYGWNDPETLCDGYEADMEESSHNLLVYDRVRTVHANYFPVKEDGFRYTREDENTSGSYLYAHAHNIWHNPDEVDYNAIVRDYDLARKVDFGEIQEYWIFGGPYFGYYESRMAGKGGYWCNAPEMHEVASSRIFVLMGFNYERGVGEMLHDYGHRSESILKHVYGSWTNDSTHAWNRFTLIEKNWSGGAACGNVHYAPNSQSNYDYANTTYVKSTCDDWLYNYPNLNGSKKWVNCNEWGCGMRTFHKWWFKHMPHVAGITTEYGMDRLNNWWAYLADFNEYEESGSTRAPGSYTTTVWGDGITALTSTNQGNWRPQINSSGRIVWHGFDGNDYEIYAINRDGSNFVQITSNNIDDEYPRINNSGQIVWQAFDGVDYEIFTANDDGTNLTQITNNDQNDWHPEINNNGRIVWDSFDESDYEIYSADFDGSDVVQITNNDGGSGYPRDDVWPDINDNGTITWMGYDGNDFEIYTASQDGSNIQQICSNDYVDEFPRINNQGVVVWHSWHSYTDAQVHAYDPSTTSKNRGEVVISTGSYEDWYPQINDAGYVVWMGHDGISWKIYRALADGSNLTTLSDNHLDNQYPQISPSGVVVWQGYDGSDWEIFMYRSGSVIQLTDNNFDDFAPVVQNDFAAWHGNSGEKENGEIYASNGSLSPAAQANIRVFLQGAYYTTGDSMHTELLQQNRIPTSQPFNIAPWNYVGTETVTSFPDSIVDWVLLELRESPDPSQNPIRRAALLTTHGHVVDVDGFSQVRFSDAAPGNYYIVVEHRNHLAVMSASSVTLSENNSSLYDFTDSQDKAYTEGDDPMISLGNGRYGMIAGDANSDGWVDELDYEDIWKTQNGSPFVYNQSADFNLDGAIDAIDYNRFYLPNYDLYTQVPGFSRKSPSPVRGSKALRPARKEKHFSQNPEVLVK